MPLTFRPIEPSDRAQTLYKKVGYAPTGHRLMSKKL